MSIWQFNSLYVFTQVLHRTQCQLTVKCIATTYSQYCVHIFKLSLICFLQICTINALHTKYMYTDSHTVTHAWVHANAYILCTCFAIHVWIGQITSSYKTHKI